MTLLPGFEPDTTEVRTWTLELLDPACLRPASRPAVAANLMRAGRAAPELARFFYLSVGARWHWVDRADWSGQQWLAWVDRPEYTLVSCWVDGVPAGYFELDQQGEEVELAYFGLMPAFIGQGLGGWLLTEALRAGWQLPGVSRVWVHTCTLDAPTALANYQARGMQVCGEEVSWRRLPSTPGQWRDDGRSPRVRGIDHLTLTVTDPERSASWYQAALGPASRAQRQGVGWHRVRLTWGSGLVIGLTAFDGDTAGDRFDPRRIGMDHVGLRCSSGEEVYRWAEHLDALGFQRGPVEDVPYGWAVTARDPDGIPVEFFCLKDR